MIPTFREVLDEAGAILRKVGALGAILVDVSPLARVERGYGGAAYQALRAQIDPVLVAVREQVRAGDLLTRDEREGDRFLLLLSPPRQMDAPFRVSDLRRLAERVEEFVGPRVARLAAPYLREQPRVEVGYGLVLHSPLESDERQVLRVLEDATECAELRRRQRERKEREALFEIIHNRKIWTVFQPIVDMHSSEIMGHEGLSRGPRGGDLQSPLVLFGVAGRQGLLEELERACRRQIFADWGHMDASGRLFINTIPATVRDSSFLGRGVLDYLGKDIAPQQVTLEITEREIIANLNLYREAMQSFLDMGFTFAIDDVGAGYSGLETMATLGASYFKIDMGLVRDVHEKRVGQQVIKAIIELGSEAGAIVIAEGVECKEEAAALKDLGVRFAQGYYYGYPVDPHAASATAASRGVAASGS